jgi:hypothetical protein
MTPRDLRKAIRECRMTASDPRIYKRAPEPPEDWSHRKRTRLKVAINAAIMFLQGSEWPETKAYLIGMKYTQALDISKARVQQYVKSGTDFLLSQGYFVEVRKSHKKKVAK